MKDSDDIANLLKQFGGRPEEYYEIGRASDARDSQARWPLLSSIEATQGEHHPPVQPHAPNAAPAPGIGGLRSRLTPPAAESQPQPETRVEPRFVPTADVPPAAPSQNAAPAATTPGARPAPQAQFVPPRPRGHIVPPTRPTAPLASNFTGLRPAGPDARPADMRAEPAPETFATPVATPQPVAATAHAAFTRPEPAGAAPATAPHDGVTPLQAIFSRLSQPKAAPERTATLDKNASLLQRLSRL